MQKTYRIRKGLNIPMKGEAEKVFTRADQAEAYAVKPIDFAGLTPKLSVKEGDKVKA
ncbi:MAG TPA: NADH:ubiquinone reductase (Na(+)-transporting) subunit A, partial [Tenuifilaceae bacterium]|nr:NADH:ubiquinone reductase (Na(+)-transporting) subunit A [Tenuifilaceae bacterium]